MSTEHPGSEAVVTTTTEKTSPEGTTTTTTTKKSGHYVVELPLVSVFISAAVADAVLLGILWWLAWGNGYEFQWGRAIPILLALNLLVIAGYAIVINADSSEGHWGGLAETFGLLIFCCGAILMFVALCTPAFLSSVHNAISPFSSSYMKRPRAVVVDPPNIATFPLSGIKIEIPQDELDKAKKDGSLFMQIELDKSKIAEPIAVPQDRKGLVVWYELKDEKGFTHESRTHGID